MIIPIFLEVSAPELVSSDGLNTSHDAFPSDPYLTPAHEPTSVLDLYQAKT